MPAQTAPLGLTHEQEQDFLKYSKVEEYFLIPANAAKVAAYPPLASRFGIFQGNLANVAPIALGTIVTATGATTNKIALKHDVANYVGVYAKVARGFCLRTDVNLPIIAANLNYTENSIFRIEDGSILQVVQAINKAINDNLIPHALFPPYGIDAAMLASGLAKATAFNTALGIGGAIKAGKTATEADVVALFAKLYEDEVQFKHIMPIFKLTDLNFYNGFVAADVEVDLMRHNSVAGTITGPIPPDNAASVPLSGVSIKNKKSGLIVHSNLLGEYELQPNRAGLTEIEISKPGYITQTIVVDIKRGRTIHLDVTLLPV